MGDSSKAGSNPAHCPSNERQRLKEKRREFNSRLFSLANASFCSIIKSRSAIQNQPEKVVVALRNSCCTGGTLQVSRRACVRFLGIESVRLSQELISDVEKQIFLDLERLYQ